MELEKMQNKEVSKDLKEREKKIDEFIKTFLVHENLNDQEVAKFRQVAIELDLDPFNKEIYVVPYTSSKKINGKWTDVRELSLITGYEVYLRRADLHPEYEGYKTEFNGVVSDPEFSCTITVFRKDRKYPTIHTAFFQEFAGKKSDGTLTKFWSKMGRFMIEKVTIGQGLRRAFPNDFSKMPYVKEEMDNNIRDVTPEKVDETSVMIETDKIVSELKGMKSELNEMKSQEVKKETNEKKTKKADNVDIPPKIETPEETLFKSEFNPAEAMDEVMTGAREITNFLSKEQIVHYQQLKISKDYSQDQHGLEEKILEILTRAYNITSFLSDNQRSHYNQLSLDDYSNEIHEGELQFLQQLEANGKDFAQEANK